LLADNGADFVRSDTYHGLALNPNCVLGQIKAQCLGARS
jgi:hypothetical protein